MTPNSILGFHVVHSLTLCPRVKLRGPLSKANATFLATWIIGKRCLSFSYKRPFTVNHEREAKCATTSPTFCFGYGSASGSSKHSSGCLRFATVIQTVAVRGIFSFPEASPKADRFTNNTSSVSRVDIGHSHVSKVRRSKLVFLL